jgi:selenide,water dikinase
VPEDKDVLVGLKSPDDAGVYKISPELAIIQTVDFFTPVVDEPYFFGQIAVANALSDVYAMGGTPKTAMNIVCFPSKEMDISILKEILKGGIDKMKEAGVVLVGGHSVDDPELKYGLSVTGFIHPERIITKKGVKEGDFLILTKPLGLGIINTCIKGGIASKQLIDKAISIMTALNKDASELMKEFPVSACTDITGFGLIGHLSEMIVQTGLSALVNTKKVPIIKEAVEFASMGFVPEGTYKNIDFYRPMIEDRLKDDILLSILFDPQTSGGLLISLPDKEAEKLLKRLWERGIQDAQIVGQIIKTGEEKIIIEE